MDVLTKAVAKPFSGARWPRSIWMPRIFFAPTRCDARSPAPMMSLNMFLWPNAAHPRSVHVPSPEPRLFYQPRRELGKAQRSTMTHSHLDPFFPPLFCPIHRIEPRTHVAIPTPQMPFSSSTTPKHGEKSQKVVDRQVASPPPPRRRHQRGLSGRATKTRRFNQGDGRGRALYFWELLHFRERCDS